MATVLDSTTLASGQKETNQRQIMIKSALPPEVLSRQSFDLCTVM